jgi:hypothetical protein
VLVLGVGKSEGPPVAAGVCELDCGLAAGSAGAGNGGSGRPFAGGPAGFVAGATGVGADGGDDGMRLGMGATVL